MCRSGEVLRKASGPVVIEKSCSRERRLQKCVESPGKPGLNHRSWSRILKRFWNFGRPQMSTNRISQHGSRPWLGSSKEFRPATWFDSMRSSPMIPCSSRPAASHWRGRQSRRRSLGNNVWPRRDGSPVG